MPAGRKSGQQLWSSETAVFALSTPMGYTTSNSASKLPPFLKESAQKWLS
jgi:hypothetical protein